MRRLAALALAALLFTGCASTSAAPTQDGPPLDPMDATPRTYESEQPTFLESAGEAVLAVPETVLWWPYKIVGSALTGGYHGVVDGVEEAPVPLVGVIASPLTAAGGIVKGTFHGFGVPPMTIGSTGEFGDALGSPWQQEIHLWK